MATTLRLLVLGVLLALTEPSLACDNYPGLPPLPGETAAETEARNDHLYGSLRAIDAYEAQKLFLKDARSIYLGRIAKRSELSGSAPLFSVDVQPVERIRGHKPTSPRTLTDVAYNSCGSWGAGSATKGKPGDWVIVFEGLPRTKENPSGVQSILARDAVVIDLIDAVEKFSYQPR